jgi:hypothetical protein
VCGYGLWELFVKNGFLLVVITVVYLQLWQKNKLVYVQHARAVIWIGLKDSSTNQLIIEVVSYFAFLLKHLLIGSELLRIT